MKPRKQLKPHNFVEKEFTWINNWTTEYRNHTRDELLRRINEASAQIHENTIRGSGNWVVFGGDVARRVDEALRSYAEEEYSILNTDVTTSDDGTTLNIDTTIVPHRAAEEISVTVTADSWSGMTF